MKGGQVGVREHDGSGDLLDKTGLAATRYGKDLMSGREGTELDWVDPSDGDARLGCL